MQFASYMVVVFCEEDVSVLFCFVFAFSYCSVLQRCVSFCWRVRKHGISRRQHAGFPHEFFSFFFLMCEYNVIHQYSSALRSLSNDLLGLCLVRLWQGLGAEAAGAAGGTNRAQRVFCHHQVTKKHADEKKNVCAPPRTTVNTSKYYCRVAPRTYFSGIYLCLLLLVYHCPVCNA